MTKISIIVPVYNVEKYLNKCIDSIVNQTYANLEIILVDDGSSDSCPIICDNYAEKDNRIKVIHKENGGVSTARNAGIDAASGAYVTFVDGDDYLSCDMVEVLHKEIINNKCDISVCDYSVVFAGDTDALSAEGHYSTEAILASTVLTRMLYIKGISNSPFAKLYKRSLLANIRFTEGITIAEDLEMNYKLLLSADMVVLCHVKLYHYLQRRGSAMNSQFNKARMDGLRITEVMYEDSKKYSIQISKATENRLFMEAIFTAIEIPYRASLYREERHECTTTIRKLRKNVLFDSESKLKHRCYALMSLISVRLLIILFRIKRSVDSTLRNAT